MIERLLVKNQLSFKTCDIEFSPKLNVFTGPSGAGKSVLMQALLALFGHGEAMADLIECEVHGELGLESFGFEEEERTIFKFLKAKNSRYFINTSGVSKKAMMEVSKTFVNYLSMKDNNEFENSRLLTLLDGVCAIHVAHHNEDVATFMGEYATYKTLEDALTNISLEEKKVEDLKEFARFEIAKIDEISPQIGEDETLLEVRKTLSKKEKIEQALQRASVIFQAEPFVHEVLNLTETRGDFFDECMNELRSLFEKQNDNLEALEEIDIESMLERIEKIGQLKKKYGSIAEALTYKKKRQEELLKYENIGFEKNKLEKSVQKNKLIVEELANKISKVRHVHLPLLEERLNHYLSQLYMPNIVLTLDEMATHEWGKDALHVGLGKVDLKKISSGEYNRVRLAFIATHNEFLQSQRGILILDEIDANLSGKESMSVANVLKILSQKYQIFAISHQPQLSSKADLHFLITKDKSQISHAKPLDSEERVMELARMISGENVSEEAIGFAKSLLESGDL